jgi:hypothetical protein
MFQSDTFYPDASSLSPLQLADVPCEWLRLLDNLIGMLNTIHIEVDGSRCLDLSARTYSRPLDVWEDPRPRQPIDESGKK